MRALAITIALAASAAACGGAHDDAAPARPALVDLSASLAPARAAFDARRGEARFLTLLAPT